jgi:hypothetical protein
MDKKKNFGADIENPFPEAAFDDLEDDFDGDSVPEAASEEVKDGPEEVFWGTLISTDDQKSSPMLYRLVICMLNSWLLIFEPN